jgi:hypothetical protein
MKLTGAEMVAAPLAAQAGTAAAASTVKIGSVAGPAERESTIVKAKQILAADSLLLALLTTGAAGFGVAKAVDDNKSDGS